MSGLSERERAIRQRLKGDFPQYAEKCLKIRPKKGEIVAFSLISPLMKSSLDEVGLV